MTRMFADSESDKARAVRTSAENGTRSEAFFYLRPRLVHDLPLLITGSYLKAELRGPKFNYEIRAGNIYYNTQPSIRRHKTRRTSDERHRSR